MRYGGGGGEELWGRSEKVGDEEESRVVGCGSGWTYVGGLDAH